MYVWTGQLRIWTRSATHPSLPTATRLSFLIRNNGEPTLILGVVVKERYNGLSLGEDLDKDIAAISTDLPLGVTLTKVTDQAINIKEAYDESAGASVATTLWDDRAAMHHAYLAEHVRTSNPAAGHALGTLVPVLGQAAEALALINRDIDKQARVPRRQRAAARIEEPTKRAVVLHPSPQLPGQALQRR